MTWVPDGKGGGEFRCGRGRPHGCAGTGRELVTKPAVAAGRERRECPVCARVDLPTYETDDGRTVLLPH